jgi:hypothetical protein
VARVARAWGGDGAAGASGALCTGRRKENGVALGEGMEQRSVLSLASMARARMAVAGSSSSDGRRQWLLTDDDGGMAWGRGTTAVAGSASALAVGGGATTRLH